MNGISADLRLTADFKIRNYKTMGVTWWKKMAEQNCFKKIENLFEKLS